MKKRPFWLKTKSLSGNCLLPHLFSEQIRHLEQIWPKTLADSIVRSEKLADQKDAIVYKNLNSLIKKFPSHLDDDLLQGCLRLQVLTNNEFFEERPVRHLMKLVCSHYFIYKRLARSLRLFPEERHLFFRLIPVRLQFPFGKKFALGLAIGICPLTKYELFDEKHVLMAIQQFIPSVSVVQGSFYVSQNPQDHIHLLYIEVEKNDGNRFSLDEIQQLRSCLSEALKARVEKLLPPLFMTRNEEEVIKTILTLGQELRHRRSLPQVAISFESQSMTEISFTVIVVHLVKAPEQSFRKITLRAGQCKWTPTRIQLVDLLEGKISKEAVVFHVSMKKNASLLRADFSVNFYLARQKIVEALQDVLGPIRDYNGGLIVEQRERLSEFKQEFTKEIVSCPELAENFFYSLEPIEVQATVEQRHLKKLFSLCLEAIETPLLRRESYFFKVETEKTHTFAIVRMRDSTMKETFLNKLISFGAENHFISTSFTFQDHYLFGYIHTSSANSSTEEFVSIIRHSINESLEKINSLQTLRLAFPSFPVSLDPRIGGDGYSSMILKMLFEGLMKYGDDGELTYGVCESVTISSDSKQYTFQLRQSFWSNQMRVTAHDFAYAWKKILSPDFYTPYAYLFHPIKWAKLAKKAVKSLDQVGIRVIDDYTLFVELEHPTPYFLELTALSIYSPVLHMLDEMHSNWAHQIGAKYICNGPFLIEKRNRTQGTLELIENPFYWDPLPTQPHRVLIMQEKAHTSIQMFKNNEIDWLGSPLQDWSSDLFENCEGNIESSVSSGIFWIIFNVNRFPFDNIKLRQAFSYAINRKELIEVFAYNGFPAFSPLPLMHSQYSETTTDDNELKALQLFHEALNELEITKENFPCISLSCGKNDVFFLTLMQFIIKKWKKIFNINCKVETDNWSVIFDRMAQGDFQLGFIRWEAWVDDPIYTLNAFRYKDERINFSKWENSLFQRFLNIADQTIDEQKRKEYLAKAEAILIQEVPVLPLLYEARQFIRNSNVSIPVRKNIGIFSFRSASINKNDR